jgi:hypothetical protein
MKDALAAASPINGCCKKRERQAARRMTRFHFGSANEGAALERQTRRRDANRLCASGAGNRINRIRR